MIRDTKLSMPNSDFSALMEEIRALACAELSPRFAPPRWRQKADGSVVTDLDLTMQQRVAAILGRLTPGIPHLGEEMSSEQQRELFGRRAGGLWCIDPLDGTSNYVSGIPFYSVSLALLDTEGPVFGLVYDPARDELFSAVKGEGARLNGQRLAPVEVDLALSDCIAIIDTKRLGNEWSPLLTDAPFRSQRCFGSGALEWCWLAAGRGQVYLHGRHQLWDYAAGWLILNEMGGCARTFEGSQDFATDLVPRSVAAASNRRLFEAMWSWLSAHRVVAAGA